MSVIAKPYPDVTVEFNEGWHSYLVTWDRHFERQKKITVTGATGTIDKPALKYWAANLTGDHIIAAIQEGKPITIELCEEAKRLHTAKSKEATTAGTLVHKYAEDFLNGLKPTIPDDPQAINGIKAFLKWVEQMDLQPEGSEIIVYSKDADYVGTTDHKGKIKRKRRVIDFKTANGLRDKKTGEPKGVYLEHRLQTAAYQHALMEMFGESFGNRIILQVDKTTGEFMAYEIEGYEEDYEGFLGCLAIKRRQQAIESQPVAYKSLIASA